MLYSTSKKFDKQFSKLPKSIQQKAISRIGVFIEDPFNPLLNNHALHGDYAEYRSINITANIRAVYKENPKGFCYFIAIGSHSELYT